jgi:hypothetical protein
LVARYSEYFQQFQLIFKWFNTKIIKKNNKFFWPFTPVDDDKKISLTISTLRTACARIYLQQKSTSFTTKISNKNNKNLLAEHKGDLEENGQVDAVAVDPLGKSTCRWPPAFQWRGQRPVQWRRSSRRQRWMAAGQHRRSGDGFAAA